ncbi:tripeptidyl peptidase A [Gloeopeniophorella convolvens]|nr:tripeptidyl peptidase A [Gloeopeniophorella convolvens]
MRPLLFSFVALALGTLHSFAIPNLHSSRANQPKLKDSVPPPRNWVDLGRAPPAHEIPLRIALPQARFDELERHLNAASDPQHAHYGAHLSKAEVEALVRPPASSAQAVDAWLAAHGVGAAQTSRSAAGDWVPYACPSRSRRRCSTRSSSVASRRGRGRRGHAVRTTRYSLPEHLHAHVELVHPTTFFSSPRAFRTTFRFGAGDAVAALDQVTAATAGLAVAPSCNTTVTLSCIQELYNIGAYRPAAADKNAIGITGYLDQFANKVDLQKFYAAQRPDALGSSFTTVLINGGQNDQTPANAGGEADLDVQIAFGLTHPTPGTFWSTGGSPPFKPDAIETANDNEPYENWVQFVLAQEKVPQTISTSYGDDEQTVPKDYAVRVCKDFAQLGARGVSVIFASGDSGVGDGDANPASQKCFSNDGKNQTRFIPVFPAGCPFVTTVGGAMQVPEVAASFSGGGFSNYFARPSWQDEAVGTFLEAPACRKAYPDVSAQSVNFLVVIGGNPELVAGTSVAAPTFAGVVGLLNDARLAAGQPTLGFLNPLLYALKGKGLNDITKGNAPGCGTPGFNATTGWDPVTGLGTPNFGELKAIVTAKPSKGSPGGLLGLLGGVLDFTLKLL